MMNTRKITLYDDSIIVTKCFFQGHISVAQVLDRFCTASCVEVCLLLLTKYFRQYSTFSNCEYVTAQKLLEVLKEHKNYTVFT